MNEWMTMDWLVRRGVLFHIIIEEIEKSVVVTKERIIYYIWKWNKCNVIICYKIFYLWHYIT